MEATYQTKLSYNEYLDKYAAYFAALARRLFVDMFIRKKPQNNLKKEFIRQYGLTARQFNSLVYSIIGIVSSYNEVLKIRIQELEGKIAHLEKWLTKQEVKLKKLRGRSEAKAIMKRKRLLFKLHQKRRRLRNLKHMLQKLQKLEAGKTPHICFGGRNLFQKQFHLAENGYLCHSDWLSDWRDARSNQFFVVGSKDESCGNQSCTYLPDNSLRLRVADAFIPEYGQYVTFNNVIFPYGQEHLDKAREIAKRKEKMQDGKTGFEVVCEFIRHVYREVNGLHILGMGDITVTNKLIAFTRELLSATIT